MKPEKNQYESTILLPLYVDQLFWYSYILINHFCITSIYESTNIYIWINQLQYKIELLKFVQLPTQQHMRYKIQGLKFCA